MADVGSITRRGSVRAELGIGVEVIFRETSCCDVCEVVCQSVATVAQDSGTDAGDSRRLGLQRSHGSHSIYRTEISQRIDHAHVIAVGEVGGKRGVPPQMRRSALQHTAHCRTHWSVSCAGCAMEIQSRKHLIE